MVAPVMPSLEAFGNLAGMLVGKKVKTTKAAPLVGPSIRGVATYVDATGAVIFVALTDVAFIASMGAALAMIPLPSVTEAIRSGKPSDVLVENAYEVLNVAASLLNDVEGATVHVKVTKLDIGAPTAELAKRLIKPAARIDLAFAIPGYPDARLSLVALS